ncbi:MAG: hypothetical protein ACRDZZ_03560 [Ilumatobacteraceae bacterium]
MATNHEASLLRSRAQALRALAIELERTPAMELERFAGTDTWRSPRADACGNQLIADQMSVFHAADDLRWTAMRFEQRAIDLEREVARLRALNAS